MSDESFLLYDPTAEPRAIAAGLAPRLASLQGMRVGILDNSKANAGTFDARGGETPEGTSRGRRSREAREAGGGSSLSGRLGRSQRV